MKLIIFVALTAMSVCAEAAGAYDILHDGKGSLSKGRPGEWIEEGGEKVLKLGGGAEHKAGQIDWNVFNLEPYRGSEVDFVFTYRTENAKKRSAEWDKTGKALEAFKPVCWYWEKENAEYSSWVWPVMDLPEGGTTDGWITKRYRSYVSPKDDFSRAGAFILANIAEGGTLYVKDFRIEPVKMPFMDVVVEKVGAKIPEDFKCEYSTKWLDGKKYRGTVAIWAFKPEDFGKIADWGCNLVRMSRFKPLEDDYAKLEANLRVLKERGVRVIFAPMAPGGKGNRNKYAIYNDDKMREDYLKGWEKLATFFKGRDDVWAFGLINEPFQGLFGNITDRYTYWQLEYEAIERIRAIDPDRPIVATADYGGSPNDYELPYMRPFPFKDVWYEIHFYSPVAYTHYQVLGKNLDLTKPGMTYPGIEIYRGNCWDKARLESVFDQSKAFSDKYGARYFVGEFSVMRRMPGAAKWLDDACDLMDSRVDLWTYHSYGEFHGWNLEYDETSPYEKPQRVKPGEESERFKVMKRHWNKK